MPIEHQPVLLGATLECLALKPGDRVIDLTVGGGGHAQAILEATAPDGALIGLDADPETLAHARQRLKRFGPRVQLIHSNFTKLSEVIHDRASFHPIRAILLDLGLSSLALGRQPARFSFLTDGPLDFRFDPTDQRPTAAQLVDQRSFEELTDIFKRYGEEPDARAIARQIVEQRRRAPFATTGQLVQAIQAVKKRRERLHPATRTFQALRIAVNDELGALESALPQAVQALAPGGRLAVISYHSLEDRIVKRFFQREARDCLCPADQPTCTCGHRATIRLLTKHPITPNRTEINTNPRSRSAKLRAAETIQ